MLYDELDFDIRRTILLSNFINEWGGPSDRKVINKGANSPVEIYVFPSEKMLKFVTIGLSAQVNKITYEAVNYELLFACGRDLAGATIGDVIDYILDIAVYSFTHATRFDVDYLIHNSQVAPNSWMMRSILVDEARAEPESFEKIRVGEQSVQLLWLIPLFEIEYNFIKIKGADKFDEKCQASDIHVIDLNRKPFV